MNRRTWLRASLLASAGLPLSTYSYTANGFPDFRSNSLIKLSGNENPYGPSPRARQAISDAILRGNRYANRQTDYDDLTNMIAEREGLTPAHVVLGAGSFSVLCMAGAAYGLEGGEIVSPFPCFSALGSYAEEVGAHVHWVPLTEAKENNLEALARQTTNRVSLVYVCNPHNPTATLLPGNRVHDFCESMARQTVVFVDEAYHEYVEDPSHRSMVPLVQQGANVIVARTFSKLYGLAGLRVGYGLARPDIAERLRTFRMGPLNVLGLVAAQASYADTDFVATSRQRNGETRLFLQRTLEAHECSYASSHTNFVFADLKHDARDIADAFEKRGILLAPGRPPYPTWQRITIGTMPEMQRFAQVLPDVLNAID